VETGDEERKRHLLLYPHVMPNPGSDEFIETEPEGEEKD